MPSEKDLRDLFGSMDAPANTLDPKRIIARSRARRLPRQIGAGAIGALAIAGIAVVAVPSIIPSQQTGISMDQTLLAPEAADGGATESTLKRAPAEKINFCGAPLAEVGSSAYGLQLDVTFPATAPVGTAPVTGTVRLTNTSEIRVSGSSYSSPAITLSQDGLVLWHTNGPVGSAGALIDLAPGESMEYPATFTPVQCGIEDDSAEVFRDDLPPVGAGTYQLSALIYFSPDESMGPTETPELDLVSGPLSDITIG